MPDIQRAQVVVYSPSQMYDLVNDIEKYPEFIPWCNKTEVLHQDEDGIKATLHFEGGGFSKSFTTHNLLQKNKMIEIKLINGPFRHLEGYWRFDPQENDGCKVMLDLEFEFSSGLLGLAFAPFFNQVANKLVESFCDRAAVVYGDK